MRFALALAATAAALSLPALAVPVAKIGECAARVRAAKRSASSRIRPRGSGMTSTTAAVANAMITMTIMSSINVKPRSPIRYCQLPISASAPCPPSLPSAPRLQTSTAPCWPGDA